MIKNIGVVGAGAMGSGIAQVAAMAGMNVFIFDSFETAILKARSTIQISLEKAEDKGKIPRGESIQILNRIRFVEDMSEFKNCDLVIEAVIENAEVKQNLFRELENIVSIKTILATNTSSLSITSIASACQHPERVIGIHFFNPAPLMPLVEIIPGITTDPLLAGEVKTLISGWGKIPVIAKDVPGFIVNRIARPYYGEAIRIYEEGIADFATIDWAMKEFGSFRMGPFELMDMIGNDINYTVTETVWKQYFFEPRYKPSLTQKRLFEAGYFGKKSGRGYYDYAEGRIQPEPTKDPDKGKYIYTRVLAMLINEAAEALYWNVATRDDIDLAMTKGVNYPKGLLKWADDIGIINVLELISDLHHTYHEERYRPSILLNKMADENKTFYD